MKALNQGGQALNQGGQALNQGRQALCVSAIASNQGKTILTMALLYHFKKSVRPFKADAKGHSFHYTNILHPKQGVDILSKTKGSNGEVGSWQKERVGTYLHVMFRSSAELIQRRFI